MIAKILIVLAVALLLLVIFIASRPADFRIQRTTVINAPASTIFPHINDLRKMNDWSPWAKMDPNSKSSYSDPATGVGASMTWAGNKEVGEGTMTVMESHPDQKVVLRLDFLKPFQATSRSEFTIGQEGASTRVTQTMSGKNNFFAKAVNLVIDCDKMVGGQFEKGLSNLKTTAESSASSQPIP